jgi:hypothetical protein
VLILRSCRSFLELQRSAATAPKSEEGSLFVED